MDRQGRIVLPAWLRQHAGITEGVVMAALNSYFEIWSVERWAEQEVQASELANLAESLEESL